MATEKKQIDFASLVYGKIPPHAKDLEMKVLGIMLLEPKTTTTVKSILSESDFYTEQHQIICKAIFSITVPDISLVSEWLVKENQLEDIGGVFTLVKLTNEVTSSVNIEQYCAIIKQKSVQRRLVSFGSEVLSKSMDQSEDVFDILSEAEFNLKNINHELADLKNTPISNIAMNVISDFESRVYKAQNNIEDENSIYTGFKEWDKLNGHLFPGLYIIAGRPGMGKGVHLTEMACRMGKHIPIGIINGEMTDEQLLKRIGCNLMSIDNFLFKKNPATVTKKETELLREAMGESLNLKLKIYNNRHINKIATRIKTWVEREGVKCILADFLTLFKVPKDLERAYNTTTLKAGYILDVFVSLCKDLKIPIILYVQMNRQILGRNGEKEPNLADLKATGDIEELAYQVSFLHRPEYYDKEAISDEMGESTKGLMYQIIAKHRDGELGRLKFKAHLPMSQIKEWEEESPYLRSFNINENPF